MLMAKPLYKRIVARREFQALRGRVLGCATPGQVEFGGEGLLLAVDRGLPLRAAAGLQLFEQAQALARFGNGGALPVDALLAVGDAAGDALRFTAQVQPITFAGREFLGPG